MTDERSPMSITARTPGAVVAFRIVYAALVLNFLIPAISYIAAPGVTLGTLDRINRTLGGGAYPSPETSHLWHMLGVGNVMTLAFLCALILADVRRFIPALPALAFLKGFSATYAFFIARAHHLPVFDAIAVLDGVTTWAMVFFAVRAHRALDPDPPGPRASWWARIVLLQPKRVDASLARLHAAGVIDRVPTHWQIVQGIVRMWHRVIFRSNTVGTCAIEPARKTWRARVLQYRLFRLPVLIAERAVAPLDFSGLLSTPERIVRHLLAAHHDGVQFAYDLELLRAHPGWLERVRDEARSVVDGTAPRAAWLRDLVVFERYHERLLAAVERALAGEFGLDPEAANDPDLSLGGYLRWCCAQPQTPAASWQRRALRRKDRAASRTDRERPSAL